MLSNHILFFNFNSHLVLNFINNSWTTVRVHLQEPSLPSSLHTKEPTRVHLYSQGVQPILHPHLLATASTLDKSRLPLHLHSQEVPPSFIFTSK